MLKNYPHLYPPKDAVHFDINLSFTFVNSVIPAMTVYTVAVPTTLLGVVPVKPGHIGVVRYTDLSSADFSNSYFSFYSGQAPIRNYVQITMPMVPQIPVKIDIQAGMPFYIYGFATAGAIAGRARVTGWLWPQDGGR